MFDNTIGDTISNKKLHPIVTELFITGRKLNISLVLISKSYFPVAKDARLSTTHFFIIKTLNRRGLQQIALIILLILTSKNLRGFTENVLQGYIHI